MTAVAAEQRPTEFRLRRNVVRCKFVVWDREVEQ